MCRKEAREYKGEKMQIILIRHGKPDYTPVDTRGFIGHGRSLAPLTPEGIAQAEEAAQNALLEGAQLIVSSPLTRALQTAAVISRVTGVCLTVEVDLREWEPDKTWQFKTSEESFALHRDFWACKGEYPDGKPRRWETVSEVVARVDPVVHTYWAKGYEKIALVTHGGVIRRFTGDSVVAYCLPYAVEYNGSYPYFGYVD